MNPHQLQPIAAATHNNNGEDSWRDAERLPVETSNASHVPILAADVADDAVPSKKSHPSKRQRKLRRQERAQAALHREQQLREQQAQQGEQKKQRRKERQQKRRKQQAAERAEEGAYTGSQFALDDTECDWYYGP
jgi:hypothetical protein